MSKNALYLCYFGLREPLVQTQVLPYLREINKLTEIKINLLTFEPDFKKRWNAEQITDQKAELNKEGISWFALPYHKTPSVPATIFDIFNGARMTRRIIKQENIEILHARSHVPALMAVLGRKFCRRKPKILFDIRGFFPEEYTDAGRWTKDGRLYKTVKRVERSLLKESDGFVVLTEKAQEILFPSSTETGFDKDGRPVEVIPCCVDLKKFDIDLESSRDEMRERLNVKDREVIVYVGSFGGYYLTGETADFYRLAKAKNPDAFALILTQSDPEIIIPLLRDGGYKENDYFIKKVTPAEIPKYLSAADFALSFIKPSYSKLASSPTKNAEYLAAGLPLVANSKVGDTAEQIGNNKIGVIVDKFSDPDLTQAYENIVSLKKTDGVAERCRHSAEALFDLETVGGMKYRRLYQRMLSGEQKK